MTLIERIRKVIDESELSSAAFADKIGVQRSSISHILSGRNKPSLDFILKVLHAYPSVQSEWLLLGKASAQPQDTINESTLFTTKQPTPTEQKESPETVTTSERTTPEIQPPLNQEIERVTVFYSDGTCSTYTNKK